MDLRRPYQRAVCVANVTLAGITRLCGVEKTKILVIDRVS